MGRIENTQAELDAWAEWQRHDAAPGEIRGGEGVHHADAETAADQVANHRVYLGFREHLRLDARAVEYPVDHVPADLIPGERDERELADIARPDIGAPRERMTVGHDQILRRTAEHLALDAGPAKWELADAEVDVLSGDALLDTRGQVDLEHDGDLRVRAV